MMTENDWDRLINIISRAGCEAYLIRLTSRTLEDAQQKAGNIAKDLLEVSNELVKLRDELEFRRKYRQEKKDYKEEMEKNDETV